MSTRARFAIALGCVLALASTGIGWLVAHHMRWEVVLIGVVMGLTGIIVTVAQRRDRRGPR